ncbi:MAG TPA: D-alanine--D-alanine ligase [Moorella mulderi]|nr:D-alanine--D-alanine ligase [Moorella mulderi]
MRIAVVMGGPSTEREISLKSGEAVAQALVSLGHEVLKVELDGDIALKLKAFNPQVVFNAVHGKWGEDGCLQGLLEILGIPYTGSGVLASALTMDKVATKRVLVQAGLPTPSFQVWRREEFQAAPREIEGKILQELGLPVVVKAPSQGSTIGTFIVRSPGELKPAIEMALSYEDRFMAEAFVAGREVTAGLLGNKEVEALPLIEIVSHTGFYDYTAKYTPGLSDHLIPPRLPQEVQERAKELARQAYLLLGCRGFARVDMIIARDEDPYIIEINSVPGMTPISLLPDAAKAAGMTFPQLVSRIIDLALEK